MSMSLTPLAARAPLKAGEVSSHTYTGWMVPPIPIPSLLSGYDYPFDDDDDDDDNGCVFFILITLHVKILVV